MFVFTARFNHRKAIAILAALGLILGALILLTGLHGRSTAASVVHTGIKTNADRIRYLSACGWEVSEFSIDEQDIIIPREFDGIYETYAALQASQGFSLQDYAGMEAVRYTYRVLNHPSGAEDVVADIIVYRGTVIAGDVQSTALDGFMHALLPQDA